MYIVGWSVLMGYGIPEAQRHIEFWAGTGFLQFSSNTTLLYWVPQHTISAWLITCLGIAVLQNKIISRFIAIPIISTLIWSPFGLIGFVPLGIYIMFSMYKQKKLKELLSFYNVVFGLLIFFIIGSYLLSNSFAFSRGFIWEKFPQFFLYFLPFVLVEFGLIAFVSYKYYRSKGGQKNLLTRIFFISCFTLLVIPLYRMGYFNDFVMRASIPALLSLQICVLYFILENSKLKVNNMQLFYASAIVMILTSGFFTPFTEIMRSYQNYQSSVPKYEEVGDISLEFTRDIEQRKGNKDSFFFRYLAKER
jgi:hypothetical protein